MGALKPSMKRELIDAPVSASKTLTVSAAVFATYQRELAIAKPFESRSPVANAGFSNSPVVAL